MTEKELIAVLYGHDSAGTYGTYDAWGFYTENAADAIRMMKMLTQDSKVYTDAGGAGTRHKDGYRHWHPTHGHKMWLFPYGSGRQYKYFHGWYGQPTKKTGGKK